jgi:hypothetical protein
MKKLTVNTLLTEMTTDFQEMMTEFQGMTTDFLEMMTEFLQMITDFLEVMTEFQGMTTEFLEMMKEVETVAINIALKDQVINFHIQYSNTSPVIEW